MRRVSANVYAEVYFWGCNPSFLTTSEGCVLFDTPQQPIDALRWKERVLEQGPIRYLINTEPHGDHIRGNAYFPGVVVIGQEGMKARYEEALPQITGEALLETMKETDPDSVWLFNHPDYPPNPPTRLFESELTLELGNHRLEVMHLPGHTAPQTAIYLPDEGVVVTGDNIFYHCKTFIQEGDPWAWLESLERILALDAEVIVPGHGEVCGKEGAREQGEIVGTWLDAIETLYRRGVSVDEAAAMDFEHLDPYPIGQRLFAMQKSLDARNVRNLYEKLEARAAAPS